MDPDEVIITPKPKDALSGMLDGLDPDVVEAVRSYAALREPIITPDGPLFVGTPVQPSMLDIICNSPIEVPRPPRRIQLTIRIPDD